MFIAKRDDGRRVVEGALIGGALLVPTLLSLGASSSGTAAYLAALLVLTPCVVFLFDRAWLVWLLILTMPLLTLLDDSGLGGQVVSIGPFKGDVIGALDSTLALTAVILLIHYRVHRPLGLLVPYLALVLWSTLGLHLSQSPDTGLRLIVRLLSPFATFCIVRVMLPRHSIIALRAVQFAAVIPILLGALQAVRLAPGAIDQAGFFLPRVPATFGHPNPYAFFLDAVLLVCLALLPRETGASRYLTVLLGLMCFLELALTGTRAAWVALVIGVLLVAPPKRSIALLAGAALVVFLVLPQVADWVVFTTQNSGQLFTARQTDNSIGNRAYIWTSLLREAQPGSVLGAGLGTTEVLVAGLFEDESIHYPHNEYLRLYIDTGGVGLACYSLFLLIPAVSASRKLRGCSPADCWRHRLTLALLAAVALISFTDNPLIYYTTMSGYWAALAVSTDDIHTEVA